MGRTSGAILERDEEAGDRRKSLKSMHKLMAVLGCFSVYDRTLSLGEIAARCGFPKTTTFRLLNTLRETKLLEQDKERDHYRLGMRLFELGSVVLANLELYREARPYFEALAYLGADGAELCVFDGTSMVDIGAAGSGADLATPIKTVRILPPHCTAVGKAVLAFQDHAGLSNILQGGLVSYTQETIVDPPALRAELNRIRKQGWALEDDELMVGRRSIGAPIRDASGKVFAGLAIYGPPDKLAKERDHALGSFVQSTALQISRLLGFRDVAPTRATLTRRPAATQPVSVAIRRTRAALRD